jgi:hypothetical protein
MVADKQSALRRATNGLGTATPRPQSQRLALQKAINYPSYQAIGLRNGVLPAVSSTDLRDSATAKRSYRPATAKFFINTGASGSISA